MWLTAPILYVTQEDTLQQHYSLNEKEINIKKP